MAARDLALAGASAHLEAGLVEEPEPVKPPAGKLAAGGVERELPIQRDTRPAFDECTALTTPAESECLEPHHRQDAETVVELGELDIAGVRSVRSHMLAPASRAAICVMSSNWSQLGLPADAVPIALT